MATLVVGDIQGCFRTLERLLDRARFHPVRDRLWSVGDLVNRGPHSLAVLRWAVSLGDRLTAVLGNHDLHLIGRADGVVGEKPGDTLDELLAASDRQELVEWLRARPLVHREGPYTLLHAGLLPSWSSSRAAALAREVERAIAEGQTETLLGPGHATPEAWDDGLEGPSRLRAIAAVLTRLRTCTPEGRPCRGFSGPPEDAPPGCLPWFEIPARASAEETVIFGHWSALGLYMGAHAIGLDTGCVWGGTLTALRLEDRAVFQEPLA